MIKSFSILSSPLISLTSTITLLIFFLPVFLWAGEWDTNPEYWGIGVIIPGDSARITGEYPPLLPPDADFPVFSEPGGALVGLLTVKKDQFGQWKPVYSSLDQTPSLDISPHDRREVYYEVSGLNYFEEKDGYLRILQNTLTGGKTGWIKKANLQAAHYKNVLWMDFLLSLGSSMFHPHDEIGLNLRKKPESSGEKITTIRGDLYMIDFTGQKEGLWAEIKVTLYTAHPCEGDEKIVSTWQGWVKLMDNAGYPNIWFYTRGC